MALSGLKEIINGILEKVRGIPGKTGGFLGKSNETPQITRGFFDKIKEPFSALVTGVKDAINNAGPNKKKPLLIGFGALAGLFLVLAIAAGISSSKKRRIVSPVAASGNLTIAVEDLFIPAEPDFVPEFIFEREKRSFWSIEDIRQYWRIPDTSERWRDEIKSAVDKLMEDIP